MSVPSSHSGPREPAAVDVVLLSMPFGPLLLPSIALGLLEATVSGAGDESPSIEILHFTIDFAERIGGSEYQWISTEHASRTRLLGEWIFSASLFPETSPGGPVSESRYASEILSPAGAQGGVPREVVEAAFEARSWASGFLDECVAEVLARRPKVVGFTSVFQQHVASLALARRLREADPSLFIVFGGANCEGVMGQETVRQFPFVDAAVSGEGEKIFPRLLDRALAGEPVDDLPGVATDGNLEAGGAATGVAPKITDMDELPLPSYDGYFRRWNDSPLAGELTPALPFETSRGCWWGDIQHCTFCGLNGLSMAFRSKSDERALDELSRLLETYPDHEVLVVDNILDMRYFGGFLPELARRRLGAELFYEVKANLKKDQVRLLSEAGVRRIQPGVESLSTRVLGLMGKGVKALHNVQLLKWCKHFGIQAQWNFIWGFPGEAPEDYHAMAALVPRLSHLSPPLFAHSIRLDRFSPNFDRGEELGFTDVEPFPAYSHVYPLAETAVSNLAYSFTFRYREPQEVERYTRGLATEISRWQEDHPRSSLVYLDKGTYLVISDQRPGSKARLHLLSEMERELYLACDGVCSLARMQRATGRLSGDALSENAVLDLLGPLMEKGLLLREGNAFLALALPAPTATRSDGEESSEVEREAAQG